MFVASKETVEATRGPWIFDHPFYIILNFAVGEAGFPGSTDATTPHTGSMWVGYVRFYQQ